jgi:hypothetical protein
MPEELKYGQDALTVTCDTGYFLGGLADNGNTQTVVCRSNGLYDEVTQCDPVQWSIAGVVVNVANETQKLSNTAVTCRRCNDCLEGGDYESCTYDEVIGQATTVSSGIFRGVVPQGPLQIVVYKMGWIETKKIIDVQGNIGLGQGANMRVSEVLPEGALRIVLRWGKHPSDLDSHIYFGKDLQEYAYHGRRTVAAAETAGFTLNLDRDSMQSGLETTTITNGGLCTSKGRCLVRFYVVNAAKTDGTLGSSGGVMTVYKGDTVVETFDISEFAGKQTGSPCSRWT